MHLQPVAIKTIKPVNVPSLVDVSVIQGNLPVIGLNYLPGRFAQLEADQDSQVWQSTDRLAGRMSPGSNCGPRIGKK